MSDQPTYVTKQDLETIFKAQMVQQTKPTEYVPISAP